MIFVSDEGGDVVIEGVEMKLLLGGSGLMGDIGV